MKQLSTLLFGLIIMLCPFMANAQNSIFDKYNDKPNVSSVYISKTMLDMQPNLYTNDVYIGKVAGQLEAVYVVSTLDATVKKSLRNDIEDFIKKGKYEILMKQKGIVSASSFYIKKKGDKIRELVMITDGAAKLSFTQLVGDLTLKDIQRITNYQDTSFNISIPMDDLKERLGDMQHSLKNMDLSALNALKDINLKDLNIDLSGLDESLKALKDIQFYDLDSLKNGTYYYIQKNKKKDK